MIKVGIIGATGYAGAELARLLLQRTDCKIVGLGSKSYVDQAFSSLYGNLYGYADEACITDDMEALAMQADVIFTATPQGYNAAHISENILRQAKVIDLSADYRLKDVSIYEKWYGIEHVAKALIEEAVYGLPEINRAKIKQARLIANPGCYPTCSILSLKPLLEAGMIEVDSIIIDAKSGTSGAGRSAKVDNLFCEVNENMKAYGIANHRHTPEIEEQLGLLAKREVMISFTPHLVPMMRGILVTAYAKLKDTYSDAQVREVYKHAYEKEKFVRVLPKGVNAQTRFVKGSNFVDVGFVLDERTGRIIVTGAMDNLIKGAAGQAIQNMNIAFGLAEDTGLLALPLFP